MTQLLRKTPIRSVWILMFLVMFCCFSGSITTWFIAKRTSQKAFAEKLDELRARGIPVDDQSMAEYHASLTSNENATELASLLDFISSPSFRADCAGLPIVSDNGPSIPPMSEAWLEQSAVEQFLIKHDKSISRLIEITQEIGPIRYPIKFNSAVTQLTCTQNTRAAIRVLLLEAHIAARNGDADREYRAINAMLGCSIALQGEPFIVSQIMSVSMSHIARIRLKYAVQGNRLRSEHYAKLADRLNKLADIDSIYRIALNGELGFETVAMLDPNKPKEEIGPLSGLAVQSGFGERAALRHAEFVEQFLEANTQDLRAFREHIQKLSPNISSSFSKFSFDQGINAEISPVVQAFSDALVKHKMANDLAILALVTRQYENKHGRLPQSLNELTEFGIDLERFKAVDDSKPLYRLTSPEQQQKYKVRAVIWSFDSRKASQISDNMPDLWDMDQLEDDGTYWWHWDLR
ncbi:MAG: hypothetical protein U0930_02925 [Pirellulales bacterium]